MMWVGNLITGGQPRPKRGEGVRAFAFHPLSPVFQLPSALAIVVVKHIASDMIHGLLQRDRARGLADHDG